MFQFEAISSRAGSILGAFKAAIPAMALAAGLATASASHADTVIFTRGDMDHARTVSIQGIGTVYAGPMLFDGYRGSYAPENRFDNLVAFCVDVYHSIRTGSYDPDLKYTDDVELTNDFKPYNPTLLTEAKIDQIGKLVNYGTAVFNEAPQGTNSQRNARWDELAAVQGAIWQVVSGLNVRHNNGHGALDTRINNLSGGNYLNFLNAAYGPYGSDITLLTMQRPYPRSYRNGGQAFAIAAPTPAPVPEPATWAMLIVGFGLTGAVIRRARQAQPATVRI